MILGLGDEGILVRLLDQAWPVLDRGCQVTRMDVVKGVFLVVPVVLDVVEKETEIGWDVGGLGRGEINAQDLCRGIFVG